MIVSTWALLLGLLLAAVVSAAMSAWAYSQGRKKGRTDPRVLFLSYTTYGPIRFYEVRFTLRHTETYTLRSAESVLAGPNGETWKIPPIFVSIGDSRNDPNDVLALVDRISFEE